MKCVDLKNVRGPVRYGMEFEDRVQEASLGILMSERCKPGDVFSASSRAKVRVGRHKAKEAAHHAFTNEILASVMVPDLRFEDEQLFNKLHLREILEMLPVAMREETKRALLANDGRTLRRLGREIREQLGDKLAG